VSSSPYIFNNIFSGNSYYGAGFNNSSSPDVYKNSFNSNYSGVITHDYSAPKLGPWNSDMGIEKGLNVIADNYRYGLLSDYYSTPFLGSSDSYNMRIGGYNSIYGNPYNVDAGDNACVEAEYNWWGSSPPDTLRFRISNDSEFHYSHYLTYNPGGGSTLSKAASTLVASGESGNNKFAGFDPKKPNPNRLSDLWLWGYDLFINNKQADAIEVYKQLISKFSGSRQAGNALVKICHMSRNTGREDLSTYLTDIIQNPEISGSLKPVALALLAGDQLFRKEAQRAVQTYETILNRYPDTKNELHALYSLVLAYNINLKDTESALKYLSVMKSKYPDEELTLMAREEMGEKVKWSLAKSGYRDHSDEKTPAIPEEYALRDNYPNPFNPHTTLAFDLPEEARVTLTIYDITGRQVMTLTRDEAFPAGFHQIRWDGQNAAGRPVSSGVYLYAMKTSTGFQRIKKMVMVK
jgi:tetratricopeptide (TPR) repeat protein